MISKRGKERDVYLVDLFAAKPPEEQIMAHQKMFNLLRRVRVKYTIRIVSILTVA